MAKVPVPTAIQDLSTSVSLLARLRLGPDRDAAWQELVRLYGPTLYHWFLRWHVQPADAADLVQDVLVRLFRNMVVFQYDERLSFRSYLKTLARYAWCDLRRRSAVDRVTAPGGGLLDDGLAGLEEREDLERRLAEQFDRELVARAMTLVASRVSQPTWEAFRLQAIDGVSAAEVGRRLGMKIASVYKARSNVLRMLQETVRSLDPGPDAPDLLPTGDFHRVGSGDAARD